MPILPHPTPSPTPRTLGRAIPADTNRDTLLRLAERYASDDAVVRTRKRAYAAAIRRRLILLLSGVAEEDRDAA